MTQIERENELIQARHEAHREAVAQSQRADYWRNAVLLAFAGGIALGAFTHFLLSH